MCGIHGFITGKKRNTDADDFIRQGFVAGALRGMDSSGIASIHTPNYGSSWQKLPVSGPMFIGDRFASSLIIAASNPDTITICHTRAATSGTIGINEAHPFIVSFENDDDTIRELIGVHNGTLTGWNYKKSAKDYTVDSEWALNHIFDKGMEAFKDFDGAYTFVFWDSKDKDVLNIVLNDQRPMHVAVTKDDGLVYASESGMLDWLCQRNGITLAGPIMKLNPNHWYRFDQYNLGKISKEKLPARPTTAPYVHQRTTTGPTTYTRTLSAVEKVSDFLSSIGKLPESKPAPITSLPRATVTGSSKVTLTVKEAANAQSMNMVNHRVKFTPMEEKGDDVLGVAMIVDTKVELDAVVRDAAHYMFDGNTVWDAAIIGVEDNGTEITLILSKPFGIVNPRGPKVSSK